MLNTSIFLKLQILFQEIDMFDFLSQLFLSFGIGGFGGFFIGFATKKIVT